MAVVAIGTAVSLALLVLLAIAAINFRMFPRLQSSAHQEHRKHTWPSLSILIPARNEADTIEQTVQLLLAQDYPQFEVIVLDDESDDGTAQVAQSVAYNDCRLRVLQGAPLAAGWIGKNWACHQLASAAQNEVLIFTDADVKWQPGALPAVVDELLLKADLLTVWPTQKTKTFAEKLAVPLMALSVHAYLPIWLVHNTSHPSAAAANGQCLVFKRECYDAVGGHSTVRDTVLEDVKLARRVKASGMKLQMAEADRLLTCRMYDGFDAVVNGYAKNILAGHNGRVSLLLASAILHNMLFVMPWLWLAFGILIALPGWPIWPVLMAAMGICVRGITARATRQSMLESIWLPVAVLLMTYIAFKAISMAVRNVEPVWKGRQLISATPHRAPES